MEAACNKQNNNVPKQNEKLHWQWVTSLLSSIRQDMILNLEYVDSSRSEKQISVPASFRLL
jgi:hypothetical protein